MNEELNLWGKASPSAEATAPFHPLVYHALDVAAVFEALVSQDERVLANFSPSSGSRKALAAALVALVALHDLGKVDRKFQAKSSTAWPAVLGSWPGPLEPYDHAAGTMKLLSDEQIGALICGEQDFFAMEYLLAPIAFHHGKPIDRHPAGHTTLSPGTIDRARRVAAAILSAFYEGAPTPLAPLAEEVAKISSWRLSGAVSLADWIGSSTEFFPYTRPEMTPREYWIEIARPRARHALSTLQLSSSPVRLTASYETLFDADWEPSPCQAHCRDLALPPGPTLVFIEDVTGSGKTEAALLLAQRLMIAGKGKGLFVALPTMATANAMYGRMAGCYRRIFAEGSAPSLALAHGRARLHDGFRASVLPNHGRAEQAVDGEIESVQAACSAFFADDRRKALLADIGVGTIDQALLAVLPTKYATLRQFGLAEKILIIDEAHAYDAYMSRELERLLTFHGGMGGSAIILSATLPRRAKEQYARAFLGGRDSTKVALGANAYPLVTTVSTRSSHEEMPVAPRADLRRRVTVSRLSSVDEAIDRIAECAARGGAVAYIRNTVDDAVEACEALQARGLRPMLFHARFAMSDRLRIEEEVLAVFGKASPAEERRGRVLVATQVVEQSLDLDFDLVVTDLAPVDLILQRAGRLWRHTARETRPIDGPSLLVVSPEPKENASADWYKNVFPRAAYVYKTHALLWLTARLLFGDGGFVAPDDIRRMIEVVYGAGAQENIPPGLRDNFDACEGRAFGELSHADNNLLDFYEGYAGDHRAWTSDVRTPTRLGEEQTVFRLALWDAGRLRPYAEDPDVARAWALSEVSVRKSRAAGRGPCEPAAEEAACLLEESWRKGGDGSVILPLEGSGPWRAAASAASGGSVRQVAVLYDRSDGLSFGGDGPSEGRFSGD